MSRPIRVALLAHFPLHLLPGHERDDPGGHYATWLPQLARAWEGSAELELDWLVLVPGRERPETLEKWGQRFHLLPSPPSGRAASLFRADRAALAAKLAELRPDLVHGWGTEDVYGLAAAFGRRPNVVSLCGILSYYVLRAKMHPREWLQAALELPVLWRADQLTVESPWGEKVLRRRRPGARISLVEYGVRDHFLTTDWKPDPARPAAIFVGSLVPRKGIQDAVQAFRDPRLQSAELWVVGGESGPWSEALRASAPENVRWLGRKDTFETAECLSRAWALVLPTRADTSPNVVKEARVIGLPVVTSPRGGQVQYVVDGECGYLVRPGDVARLADALADLLGSYDRARAFGAAHHAEHRRLLDPARTAEGFLGVYRRMTGRGA